MATSSKASAPEATDTAAPAPAPGEDFTEVVYRGEASLRTISREQWLAAGVPDQDTTSWDRNTGLSRDHFTNAALEVLRRDANFKFE